MLICLVTLSIYLFLNLQGGLEGGGNILFYVFVVVVVFPHNLQYLSFPITNEDYKLLSQAIKY